MAEMIYVYACNYIVGLSIINEPEQALVTLDGFYTTG